MNLSPSTQINLFGLNNFFLELTNLFDQKKFPNKILLSGEKGSGKCTLAYHIINYILSKDEDLSPSKFEKHIQKLEKKMLSAAENLDFEKAAMFRDEIRKIKKDQMGMRK